MKRTYLTLIAILSVFQFSYAQWTTGTGTIFTTNIVGIGTTSPAYPLDVQTNVNATTSVQFTNASTGTSARTRFTLSNGVNYAALNLNGSTYPTDPNALEIFAPSTGGALIFGAGGSAWMRITQTGNVGIGTSAPADKLDIYGDNPVLRLTDYSQGNTSFFQQLNNAYGGGLRLYDGTGYSMRFSGGNVGICTTDNTSWQLATSIYKLAVGGGIIATSVTVKTGQNWPDYVFKPSYHLMQLTAVKTYIDQNHHLPGMPSEHQVAKDGINLGEMNKLLTQKVEELTLYLIEKDKKEKEEEAVNQKQQTQIDLLIKQVTELSKKK